MNPSPNKPETPSGLQLLLSTRDSIRKNVAQQITFSQPILCHQGKPVFFPRTINVIQGKAGSHKSRLTQTICAALLKTTTAQNDLLGFSANPACLHTVCYVDTERNLSDQFPFALQQILLSAGFARGDEPPSLDYISLLEFGREHRFDLLNSYLEHVRGLRKGHIFIVLDVVTDCIFNFNDTRDSLRLIDMMNQAINRYDVTFLCIIHENPGIGGKARGHLGTEIINKASTVISIGFENNPKGRHNTEVPEIIRISYLKCRNSRMHPPFFAQYSDVTQGLVQADPASLHKALVARSVKAVLAEVTDLLPFYLTHPLPKQELIDLLCAELSCKPRTIEKRLRDIISQRIPVHGSGGVEHYLQKVFEGREIVYSLTN